MKNKVKITVMELGATVSYSGKAKTMYINSTSDAIEMFILGIHGYSLPFKIATNKQ